MPKLMHVQLARMARQKGLKPGTPAFDRYVYGTMAKKKKGK